MNLFIAIDIGNTHTVIGVYWKQVFISECRVESSTRLTVREISSQFRTLLRDVGKNKTNVHGVGISSVVPRLTALYTTVVKNLFLMEPVVVHSATPLGIKIHYDNPQSLGPDRICSAIAGYAKYGGPLLIIDFGTATTYDIIAANGDFLGGVIAPGIETSALALHKRTAKLPKLAREDLRIPQSIIGTNTRSGMQTGILLGALDAMAGMVKRIQKELVRLQSKKAVVVATGGFSTFVAEQTRIIEHVEPTLVLDGIRLICDRVKRQKGTKSHQD